MITLHVNGNPVQTEADPSTPLLYILRNELGLTGPKLGCAREQCFACAVLIDGAAVPSCDIPIEKVANLKITTIEGLGTPEQPHLLQEAFAEEQAAQCGYCTSGMIISAQGLLNRVRYPSDEEINTSLSTNLCRCGVYDRVRRAIKLTVGHLDPDGPKPFTLIKPATPPSTEQAHPTLSSSLKKNGTIDHWLEIKAEGTVLIKSGKVEIGQGIKTAIAQIAADELDVDLGRIRLVQADTSRSPDEGKTSGSMTLQTSGMAIRQAAADARHHILHTAHEALEGTVPPGQLEVNDGTIRDPNTGQSVTYWEIQGDQAFGLDVTGVGRLKDPEQYNYVGSIMPRLDLLGKVTGTHPYLHDFSLPNMLHARAVRPPAYTDQLIDIDTATVEALPGVVGIVRDGSFLAVVAKTEFEAVKASEALANEAMWSIEADLPAMDEIDAQLTSRADHSFRIIDGVPHPLDPSSNGSTAGEKLTFSATYRRPYQMHAALGPSVAVALSEGDLLTVWQQSQGVFPIRSRIANVLKRPLESVRAIHMEGSGSYGNSAAGDAALDAAIIATRFPGQPVRVMWSRADEHGWEPYAPAMHIDIGAELDEAGQIIKWEHTVWSYPHVVRDQPDHSFLVAGWHLEKPQPVPTAVPIMGPHFGEFRNADPIYALPNKEIISHLNVDTPLRVAAFRGLGAHGNLLAIESFMDELALQANIDPVQFRLNHLEDERAQAVLTAAIERFGWESLATADRPNIGKGVALARYKNVQGYSAICVLVRIDETAKEIYLDKVVIAADVGQIIHPDNLSSQLEGGFVQAASMALYEQVKFSPSGIESRDWESYPILRISNAPEIETILINRPYEPVVGAGETTIGHTCAAIGNAVFDATGVRLREVPFVEKLFSGQ